MEVSEITEQQLKIAWERLDAAKCPFDGGFYKDSVRRAYYLMYHAAVAILTLKNIKARRHFGVLRMFGLHAIQEEDMAHYYAKALKFAKGEREKGDYYIFSEISEEESETVMGDAEKFLFIDLTKERHLAHVFVATSDSLFMESVYSEAMLEGRCRYLLVDDFDYGVTAAFLKKYGFTADETAVAWEYCGGKPICLVELVNLKLGGKDVGHESKKLLKIRTSQMLSIFDEIALGKIKYSEKDIIEEFRNFEQDEMLQYDRITEEKIFLVGRNVFFIDPTQRTIKPQSRLNLLALREVLRR
ncbi:MAG: ATP-binding protein [Euryarchaeota archaeon]|nr:ATP-binding protein [Euryarchaeota archaeon]